MVFLIADSTMYYPSFAKPGEDCLVMIIQNITFKITCLLPS